MEGTITYSVEHVASTTLTASYSPEPAGIRRQEDTTMPNLYLVADGVATLNEQADQVADWRGSAAVVAETEDEALAVAETFDREEIGPTNVVYDGRTVSALRPFVGAEVALRSDDRETGMKDTITYSVEHVWRYKLVTHDVMEIEQTSKLREVTLPARWQDPKLALQAVRRRKGTVTEQEHNGWVVIHAADGNIYVLKPLNPEDLRHRGWAMCS